MANLGARIFEDQERPLASALASKSLFDHMLLGAKGLMTYEFDRGNEDITGKFSCYFFMMHWTPNSLWYACRTVHSSSIINEDFSRESPLFPTATNKKTRSAGSFYIFHCQNVRSDRLHSRPMATRVGMDPLWILNGKARFPIWIFCSPPASRERWKVWKDIVKKVEPTSAKGDGEWI